MKRPSAAFVPLVLLLLFGAGILLLTSCAPAPKKLVVYSAGPRPLAEKICQSYTRETGQQVELFTATTGQLLSKLEAERFNPRADVVILASRVAAEALKTSGRLQPLEQPHDHLAAPAASASVSEITNTSAPLGRAAWNDADGHFYSMAGSLIGVALRADAPAGNWDWDDFLEGRFQGRLCMPSPTRSGSSGDFVMAYLLERPDSAWREFKHARGGGMDIAGANAQAITGLMTGAYQAVIGAVDYVVLREIARGEPLRMYYPKSGGVLVVRPVAVLASSKQKTAAIAFVRHCFGKEVQQEVAKLHFVPADVAIPLSKIRQAAVAGTNVAQFPLNARAALAAQSTLMRRFQYEVERAVIVDDVKPARTP